MPFSDQSNQPWLIEELQKLDLTSMLDVGPGAGTYGHMFFAHFPLSTRTAVEVWKTYIYNYDLFNVYQTIHLSDVRRHNDFNYDIVIFGDILEHMTKEDALKVWDKVSKQAKYAVISIPIVHYPQDAYEGNPYEIHVKDDWTHEEVLDTFTEIVKHKTSQIVGTYIADFQTGFNGD
jgi:S-adenosylmethionine:diacylglycerol 3-amino-3-carboxypropyl transferase